MFRWSFKTGSPAAGGGSGTGGGRSTREINQATQRRFARGVDCNMKILIRGERKTGKSALLARLQGKPAPHEYKQTPQIDVANISWKYKSTPGVVKVELWDVVDQGIPSTAELPTGEPVPCLDASFIDDIYKGVHGVIFLFDVAKHWTFKYVEREMLSVPPSIPILILANFQDAATPTSTTLDEVQAAVAAVPRPRNAAGIYCAAASVVNDFGLSFVNKFFGMPYLYVQRLWHEAQLKANRTEAGSLDSELSAIGPDAEEQSFTKFVERRKARQAEKERAAREAEMKRALQAQEQQQHEKQSVFARMRSTFSSKRSEQQQQQQQKAQQQHKAGTASAPSQVTSVDEFVPDAELPDDFFGGDDSAGSTAPTTAGTGTQQQRDTQGKASGDGGDGRHRVGGSVEMHAGTGSAVVLQDDDDEEEEDSDAAGNQLVMGDISDFEDDDSDLNVGIASDSDASSDDNHERAGGGAPKKTTKKKEESEEAEDKANTKAKGKIADTRVEGRAVAGVAPAVDIAHATKTESETDDPPREPQEHHHQQQQQDAAEDEVEKAEAAPPSFDVPVPAGAAIVDGDSDDDDDEGPNPLLMADEDVSDDELKVDVDDDVEVSDDSEADATSSPPQRQQQEQQEPGEGTKTSLVGASGEVGKDVQTSTAERSAAEEAKKAKKEKEARGGSSGDGAVVSGAEEEARKQRKKKSGEKKDKDKIKKRKKKKAATGQKQNGEELDPDDDGTKRDKGKKKKKKGSKEKKKKKKKGKGDVGVPGSHSDGGNSELDAFLNDAPYSPTGSKPADYEEDDDEEEDAYDDDVAPSMHTAGDYTPL